jgi:hypothetical protein
MSDAPREKIFIISIVGGWSAKPKKPQAVGSACGLKKTG